MSKQKDGGQAFPRSIDRCDGEDGMSLRDYFAAKAMLGRMSWDPHIDTTFAEIAEQAYGIADAMLETREENR